MSYLTFKDQLRLEKNYGVVLCNSVTPEGKPFFHYVMADKKNIEKMHRDFEKGGDVDFTSYGEILISGWGETPPPEYEQIMDEYFQTS